ncbi:MAG TPA: hypothetical protein VFW87_08960, partial [Pirellulales bacterium]|nr:hypothetical protein [Pirellulales bacterium]
DEAALSRKFKSRIVPQSSRIHDDPAVSTTLPLRTIRDFVQSQLVGKRILPSPTKNRGQQLEQMVAAGLGYRVTDDDVLIGGYPDIRHQALEVKIQDARQSILAGIHRSSMNRSTAAQALRPKPSVI